MRKIDPSFATGVDAVLLVRRSTIVFSMARIAAVILRDRCYIIVPRGADSILSVIMDRLRDVELQGGRRLSDDDDDKPCESSKMPSTKNDNDDIAENASDDDDGDGVDSVKAKDRNDGDQNVDDSSPVPFEFVALEAMLAAMRDTITKQLAALESKSRHALTKLRQNVLTQGRETLFLASEELHEVELRVSAIEKALGEVLDSDDDMACMYLTRLFQCPSAFDSPDFAMYHEEAELLLESYLQDVRAIGARAERLRFEITSTEKLVNLELDAVRNRLLQVDLALETMTMTIGFGAMVAGLYGMNLKSGYEESDNWFWTVFILIFGITLLVPPVLFFLFRFFGFHKSSSKASTRNR